MKAKIFFIQLMLVYLCGCSVLVAMFDDNPALMNIAIKQGVSRFIEKSGNTEARAKTVDHVLATAQVYIAENTKAPIQEVIKVINDQIDYDRITKADQLLIEDLFNLVIVELTNLEKEEGALPDDQQYAIRAMISAARVAAQTYFSG